MWAKGASLNQMLVLSDWGMYDQFTGDEERRLTGGNLLKELLANVDARLSQQNVRPPLHYYSTACVRVASSTMFAPIAAGDGACLAVFRA